MDNNTPLQIRKFNDRVRAMNQANAKSLTLTAEEARVLHSEIYDMLASVADFITKNQSTGTTEISMDGGTF